MLLAGGWRGFCLFILSDGWLVLSCAREALGMGDVLLFAGLGTWIGPLLLPDVALVASLCALIYAVTTGKYASTVPFGPFLSLGGMVALYIQALM
ncbi:prepilin peptidase [Escherichia coli]|uniref:prepilin peptidase n=1 Tax=Escherichia coli TaxID=562 RepID=UPI003D9C07D7